MYKRIITNLTLIVSILFISQAAVKALSIADNRELYTDNLTKPEIVSIEKIEKVNITIEYQARDGGGFICDRQNPPECNLETKEVEDYSDSVTGSGQLYILRDGRKILSIKAASKKLNLKTFTIQQEYFDIPTNSKKRAKIVSLNGDFFAGLNLISDRISTSQFTNHSNDKEYNYGYIGLQLSTKKRELGLGHWRDYGNVKIKVQAFNLIKDEVKIYKE